jgi:ArsR family transcriptional regulator
MSKHLSILHQAGLLQSRKTERWVYYRLPDREKTPVTVREALDWVRKSLAKSAESAADTNRLANILKMNLKTICRRQCRGRSC